jgi:hypothetical protein
MSIVVGYRTINPPGRIKAKNYIIDGEPHFKHTERIKTLQHLVLHETAGRSADACKATLLKKGYGVHLILDRDGTLSCHGDLKLNVMAHANQCNATSVGIEVVNPYAPRLAWGMKDIAFCEAVWWTWCPNKEDRRYVLPTNAQLEVLLVLVPWLCAVTGIPYEFPTAGLSKKKHKITGWNKPPLGWSSQPGPGIVAHQDFAKHADGRYLLEYLIANR